MGPRIEACVTAQSRQESSVFSQASRDTPHPIVHIDRHFPINEFNLDGWEPEQFQVKKKYGSYFEVVLSEEL